MLAGSAALLYPKAERRFSMDVHIWAAFAAASLLMGLIPGPGVASIVGFAFSSGRKTALASVAGMALGNAMAISLSLAGAGAVLAASVMAFAVLKYLGAAYLVILGILAIIRSKGGVTEQQAAKAISPKVAFLSNVMIGTFHPKTIIFFVAFAPQFISANASYAGQAAILVVTFTAAAAMTDTLYALTASRASTMLAKPKYRLWGQRLGGGVLIAAGAATAAIRK
jgi:threonine/homoserine/homoserine lactone efflux protein